MRLSRLSGTGDRAARRVVRSQFLGLLGVLLIPPQVLLAEELQLFSDDINRVRNHVSAQGIRLETVNTTDVLANVSGGISPGREAPGNLDLILTLNAEQLLGWRGGTFFVYGLGNYGNDPSRHVGDAQTVSNIAAPNTWKLFEAWYQENFFDQRLSFLLGLYDVTSEFQVIREASELFVNSSFGTTPEFANSGVNGLSTFPTTAAGLRVQFLPTEEWALRFAVMDGIPGDPEDPKGTEITISSEHGVFAVAELAYEFFYELHQDPGETAKALLAEKPRRKLRRRIGRAAPLEYDAKYAIGAWVYSTELEDLRDVNGAGKPVTHRGSFGLYGIIEHRVYEEVDHEQGLTLFAQVGLADARVNRFTSYYGGGLVYTGWIPGRNLDQIGFGVAAARNGDRFKSVQRLASLSVDDAEIALEWTYAAFLLLDPVLVVQPDIQYVINPGTNPAFDNAWVIGVRIEAGLEWFK